MIHIYILSDRNGGGRNTIFSKLFLASATNSKHQQAGSMQIASGPLLHTCHIMIKRAGRVVTIWVCVLTNECERTFLTTTYSSTLWGGIANICYTGVQSISWYQAGHAHTTWWSCLLYSSIKRNSETILQIRQHFRYRRRDSRYYFSERRSK